MRNEKNSDQIKVHVINVGYDVKGTDVIAHLVWRPVLPDNYCESIASPWASIWDGQKHRSVGVAHLQEGDVFDLKKGQRIALAKAETAAYGVVVKSVKEQLNNISRGLQQAQDFLTKAQRVKDGNARYIQRVDAGEIK